MAATLQANLNRSSPLAIAGFHGDTSIFMIELMAGSRGEERKPAPVNARRERPWGDSLRQPEGRKEMIEQSGIESRL
jgi:hypothetical protein